jgi:hypothetical protein
VIRSCGVTAFTFEDALWLMRELVFKDEPMPPIREAIEDVDIPTLDTHVRSNMSVPIWRGVWHPPIGPPLR